MSAADKLAQVLAEHNEIRYWADNKLCGCGECINGIDIETHQAAAVLAHLTAEGWAQGREEWGYRLAEVHSTICRSTSRERAEEVARLNPALDPHIFVRRVTDWEPVETGDQE